MGRRKNKRHGNFNREAVVVTPAKWVPPAWTRQQTPQTGVQQEEMRISEEEDKFRELVELAGFPLPWQFKNWRRYFLTEESFLKEAERWLSARLQGNFIKIEDDQDKGLKPKTTWNGWSEGDPWWDFQGGGGRMTGFHEPALPLTPKIPAPTEAGLGNHEIL